MMRTMVLIAVMMAGCMPGGERSAVQAVAGPGGVTVTVRAAGQLAVSWSADTAAVQYRVLRSTSGGAFMLLDSVAGSPPSTSYIDTALSGGVSYCYAIAAAYSDGSTSDPGAPVCAAMSTAIDRVKALSALNVVGQSGGNWTAGMGVNAAFAISTSGVTLGTPWLAVPVDLDPGDRVKSIDLAVFGTGAQLSVLVNAVNAAMVGTSIGSVAVQPSTSWSHVPLDVADTTLAAGGTFQIVLSASGPGIRVGTITVTYDHP